MHSVFGQSVGERREQTECDWELPSLGLAQGLAMLGYSRKEGAHGSRVITTRISIRERSSMRENALLERSRAMLESVKERLLPLLHSNFEGRKLAGILQTGIKIEQPRVCMPHQIVIPKAKDDNHDSSPDSRLSTSRPSREITHRTSPRTPGATIRTVP